VEEEAVDVDHQEAEVVEEEDVVVEAEVDSVMKDPQQKL